ncbi:PAP/fibrillin family protein [Prochlorococcus marinus]|uniref:PAP/fibrillin family protein n=1 Tax=Prochlorococcus marinus TaxID=1219 RepID=UPI0022B47115|nr:PAP/fibrillin family protein [Prochlorococcus marinus]
MDNTLKLIEFLEQAPNSKKIIQLIELAECEFSVDITKQINHLKGVWELRWSSSKSPFLNYSPLLDNLQIIDPENDRGLNFLRPKGFLGNILATNILAELNIIDQKRINVSFKKAGIIGPQLLGKNIGLFSEIKKTQKGWLDTTVLTNKLRVCKGYKGTTFALLKREDLLTADFFNLIIN